MSDDERGGRTYSVTSEFGHYGLEGLFGLFEEVTELSILVS